MDEKHPTPFASGAIELGSATESHRTYWAGLLARLEQFGRVACGD
jgi:hypothetical protein